MAARYMIVIALTCSVALQSVLVHGDEYPSETQAQSQGGFLSRVPGAQTAAAFGASSADAMSRYLAKDGPIQPAITAGAGVPVRVAEVVNGGISRISSSLNNQAQSMSRAAGQDGQIRMPGWERTRNMMPEPLSRLGQMAQNGVRRKNQWIMNQADQGVRSADRQYQSIHGNSASGASSGADSGASLSVQAADPSNMLSGSMEGAGNMLSSAQQQLSNGASQLSNQASQQLANGMGGVNQLRGAGQEVIGQVQDIFKTLAGGLQGTLGQIHQTGQQLLSQVQNNHQKNMQAITSTLSGLNPTGRLNSMQQDLQQRMGGAAQSAQGAAQQLNNRLQQTAQGGMQMARDGLRSAQEGVQPPMRAAQETAQQLNTDLQRTAQESFKAAENSMKYSMKTAQDGIEKAREGINAAQQGVQPAIQSAQETAQHLGQGIQRTAQESFNAARKGLPSSGSV